MKTKLILFVALFSALFVFASCLKGDDNETITYSDTAITAFSLGNLKYPKHGKTKKGADTIFQVKLTGSNYKFYIDQIIQHDERYTFLYQVRPGVTSYATLYNGYTDTMDKMLRRLELDLYYLRKRSWWFDIKILINTFLNIAIGKKF